MLDGMTIVNKLEIRICCLLLGKVVGVLFCNKEGIPEIMGR